MKTRILTFCFLTIAFAPRALGQYSIGWFTIDGGAGTSTNAAYSLTGTIAQPDAGRMSGDNFTLEGGFWGIVAAIQTPDAPLLSITRTNSTVTVSWPTAAKGWQLEQTNRLTGLPGSWPGVPFPLVTNATDIRVFIPVTASNRFLRLYRP